MKAKEWETKKRSSKGSLLSLTVTSYIYPFSQELIVLGIIWGKSQCIPIFLGFKNSPSQCRVKKTLKGISIGVLADSEQ